MKSKSINILARVAILVATLIWGSTFVLMKDTVSVMSPSWLLFFRFTVGWMLLAIIFNKKLKLLNKSYVLGGAVIGLCLFLAYFTQTLGIADTTPGKNAMLTAGYCVLVPFLMWGVNRKRPDAFNIIAALLCIVGIGMVALTSNGEKFTIVPGDTLTLVGAFFYAAHIVAVWTFARDKDMILVTILQFFYCSVFSLALAFVTGQELDFANIPLSNIYMLAYLAVFGTTIALLFQNIGQKYVPPSAASILLSLESVFGVMFSLIFFADEKKDPIIFIGFALVMIAVIISETKLDFIFKKQDKSL